MSTQIFSKLSKSISALSIILMSTTLLASSLAITASAQDIQKSASEKSKRIAVTIYEMRSSVYEIAPRAATDMFTAALFKSKKFRVLERQRVAESVARERDLNG